MLDRTRRAGPLAVDALPALVEEQISVTRTRMQLGDVVGDENEAGVVPRASADPIPRVCQLIGVGGIPLHTQVGAPGARALPCRGGQPLTRRIGSGKAPRLPVALVALVTKKLIDRPVGEVGVSSQPAARISVRIR